MNISYICIEEESTAFVITNKDENQNDYCGHDAIYFSNGSFSF